MIFCCFQNESPTGKSSTKGGKKGEIKTIQKDEKSDIRPLRAPIKLEECVWLATMEYLRARGEQILTGLPQEATTSGQK